MVGVLQDVAATANGGVLRRLEQVGASADPASTSVLLVPTEDVLLLAVDLPLTSHRRRMEALPFAVEERIAEPLDAVHLALGAEIGDRRYLAGVVRHEAMARWIAEAPDAFLVPDALVLPVPESGWTVATQDARVLVRRDDGTGFALPAAQFAAAWTAAGSPALFGNAPPGVTATPLKPSPVTIARPPALDLRQGIYARPVVSSPLRRLAAVAAVGLLAHGAIAAADTVALRYIADRWRDETMLEVTRLRPGTQLAGDDLAGAAADLVPVGGTVAHGRLLPLLNRASAALGPGTILRGFAFEGDRLTLEVATSTEAAVTARLRGAGLVPLRTSGSDGSVRLTISGGA